VRGQLIECEYRKRVARTAGFAVRGLSTNPRKNRGPQNRRSALPRSQGEGQSSGDDLQMVAGDEAG